MVEEEEEGIIRKTTTSTIGGIQILVVVVVLVMVGAGRVRVVEGVWCVARSDATDDALQTALDYACAAGADCAPIQQTGLCFLPNTLQAHASYAFNSYYQRNHMASGSCDFSRTATLAKTDPSYGSCVYPASPSTAGGIASTASGSGTTPTTNPYGYGYGYGGGGTSTTPMTPTTTSPPTFNGGAGGGLNPNNMNMGPPIPTTNGSKAALLPFSVAKTLALEFLSLLLLHILPSSAAAFF